MVVSCLTWFWGPKPDHLKNILPSELLSHLAIPVITCYLLYVHECVCGTGHSTHMKVRGQPVGIGFLFPSYGLQGLIQVIRLARASLHVDPSFWPPCVLSKQPQSLKEAICEEQG